MTFQYILELAGTYFFAVSGAVAVKDKDQDWFGAAFTGFITAIGGGSLRDILLGSYPLVWIDDVRLIYAIVAGVATTFLFFRVIARLRRTFLLFDSLGIAFFTILGLEKALSLGVTAEIAVIMGMFTGVMGGVIRDTLTNEMPVIFRKEVYATACLSGAGVYLLLYYLGLGRNPNMVISIGLVVAIRLLAVRYKLSLPTLK